MTEVTPFWSTNLWITILYQYHGYVLIYWYATRLALGSRKKIFFSGLDTKALPPSSLVARFYSGFFRASKKLHYLSGPAFAPPPFLVTGPLKKNFFKASRQNIYNIYRYVLYVQESNFIVYSVLTVQKRTKLIGHTECQSFLDREIQLQYCNKRWSNSSTLIGDLQRQNCGSGSGRIGVF